MNDCNGTTEVLKNQTIVMDDSPKKLFGLNNPAVNIGPILENEALMSSTECKALKLVKDEFLVQEEVDINCDKSNVQEGIMNEFSTSAKQKFINLRDIRLRNFQQSQFLNIPEGSSNLSVKIAPSKNGKVLIRGKNIESHLKVCKQNSKYPCNKCSFVTWNKSLLTQHIEAAHEPKACPKCTLICKNEKNFLLHYEQFCKSENDIYVCKICKYQYRKMSMLSLHFKLMHSVPKVVKVEKSIFPRKKAVNLIHHGSSQNITPNNNMPKIIILVPAEFLNSKDDNNFVEQDSTANSLLLASQRNSSDQNNVANSLLSLDSYDSIEKDCFVEKEMIVETGSKQINQPNNNNQTNIAKGYYYCLKCDFKSPFKSIVRRHCEEYHPEISDPLGSNNESEFIEYRALENSPKNISVLELIVCEQCGKKFTSSVVFERHLSNCMTPLTFLCDDCPFRTKTKINLRNHIRLVHLNLCSINEGYLAKPSYVRSRRMHQCLQCYCMNCGKRYAVKLCANKCPKCKKLLHIRCQICTNTFKPNDVQACEHAKTFLSKLDIDRYTLSKTGRYQCNDCSFEVARNRLSYLKRHILGFHVKSRNNPCTKCSWDFKSISGLRKHLAYCGKKLYMQCKVILTRVKVEDVRISIKEEVADSKEDET